MSGEIHIYGLVDPRDREIKYVGQTISPDRRLKQHIADTGSGTPKSDWINEMGDRKPLMVILDTVAQEDAHAVENWWILFCRYKGWQNVNGTNPGAWRADFGEMFSEDLERQYSEFVARLESAEPPKKTPNGWAVLEMWMAKAYRVTGAIAIMAVILGFSLPSVSMDVVSVPHLSSFRWLALVSILLVSFQALAIMKVSPKSEWVRCNNNEH